MHRLRKRWSVLAATRSFVAVSIVVVVVVVGGVGDR
jgi:hypothetical protein